MHVHLDAIGGIAGDMFVAGCLDAWPELIDGLEPVLRAAGLPSDWAVEITNANSHGIAGTRVRFAASEDAEHRPTGNHGEIRDRLGASDLETAVAQRAIDIFQLLAEAEASAHGVPIDGVHFHEIADWDSVADIVAAAWLIDSCGATSWSVSALPIGSGTVETAHGNLPIPAPATAYLLRGMEVVDDGIAGERVTPTGAAIVRHLDVTAGGPRIGTFGATGHGLGTRDLPDRPNLLRLRVLETSDGSPTEAQPWDTNTVTTISFDVDDQTPEDLAVGLDKLRQHEAVLDVTQAAVSAKKGRVATHIQVLCRPTDRDNVIAACFEQTTTIGLRWLDAHRAELRRRDTERDGLTGKVALRPDGSISAKPEMDDVAATTDSHVDRASATARFLQAPDEPT